MLFALLSPKCACQIQKTILAASVGDAAAVDPNGTRRL